MDFNDTPEEAEFRAEARAFLGKHAELRRDDDVETRVDIEAPGAIKAAQEWQALKKDNGWACLTWPKAYGGRDAKPIEAVIWNQEEAGFRTPSTQVFGIGIGMLGPTLMAHGTAEQKQKFLEPMARGDDIWCQLFSEPSAGSDLAGLRTSARRDGDDWVISGQKIWTSGAHYCRYGMIVTRTDPDVPKHDGLTYFIVDMEAPGIEIRPIKQINGSANFNEVFFSDVRVPDGNRVGQVGEGWRVSITTLMNERASLGGGSYGPSVENLIQLAKKIEIDGRPAIENSWVRDRIASFHVRLRGVKHTGNRTLTALSRGETPGPESSIGKLVTAPLSQELASFAVELQGMAGGMMEDEFGFQEFYLSSPGIRLAGGTDEILHNILAERVLGLPPEIRADKGVAFRDVPTGPAGS
jgi:alkylation response protein AidB-like acyl-CoA dehydrogenase